jgi:hypothetical protein
MKNDARVLLFAVLLAAFVCVSTGIVNGAEAPEEEWNRTFGGSNYDYGYAVQQTTDGGYIITGYTQSFGIDSPDVWLVKTAANGSAEWSRTFGGSWYDSGYAVQETKDGGYIVAGSTHSFGAGSNDVWLIKTVANGSEDWKRTFGGDSNDYGYAVQQTTDGGYIVAGSTASFGAGVDDVWLLKVAANGSEDWNRTFGGNSNDYGYAVRQTTDGGYIVAGSTKSFSVGSGDLWLLKVSANGTADWNRTFGGPSDDGGQAVQQTKDGGYIVAGSTRTFGAGSGDVWLLKTAANGTADWNRAFGGFSDEVGHSVQQTTDGGYILVGSTRTFGAGSGDVWLLKTAANGSEHWNMTFGGFADEAGHAVQQTIDRGYIVAGYTHTFGVGSGDVWLIKVAGEPAEPPIFDTGKGTYPSISGTFNGTITPSCNLTVSKLYTYPCTGTGGHSEYATFSHLNGTIAEAHWNGYTGDWHNLTFNNSFTLYANQTYTYTIRMGSYPQIIHAESKDVTGGRITCTSFIDINGKRHDGWIPAIRLQ